MSGFIAQTAEDYALDYDTVETAYIRYFKDSPTGFYEALESIIENRARQ